MLDTDLEDFHADAFGDIRAEIIAQGRLLGSVATAGQAAPPYGQNPSRSRGGRGVRPGCRCRRGSLAATALILHPGIFSARLRQDATSDRADPGGSCRT
ncbi:hypothetical protein GCM10009765_16890 [Fodinicola feengrottensis]|uniref:Uncharacterized protein n=1 Tax=Fodinicola feengrottensis TaxID=435914 RepID=A0ABN2GBS0_9ACTN